MKINLDSKKPGISATDIKHKIATPKNMKENRF